MSKQVTLSELQNVTWRFIPNPERDNPTIPGEKQYAPMLIKMSANGVGQGASEPVSVIETLGAWQTDPYTPKELYTLINGTANLHTILAGKLKDLYLEINEDITQ